MYTCCNNVAKIPRHWHNTMNIFEMVNIYKSKFKVRSHGLLGLSTHLFSLESTTNVDETIEPPTVDQQWSFNKNNTFKYIFVVLWIMSVRVTKTYSAINIVSQNFYQNIILSKYKLTELIFEKLNNNG